ncbi:hypothetical protein OL239_01820 [Arthrobacter sp. ATA002]|uniref:hypothetical protein n=1 Tax=Arthrobacter sp. ATA002 TaxID=2991715 RepID=UPI0022A7A575|nr:hypothetical protein [Arthrobacter sp. ATA002]WAP52085.1 hypothetical protein OL239_01820 [Arthrobacter sp. ATA002]
MNNRTLALPSLAFASLLLFGCAATGGPDVQNAPAAGSETVSAAAEPEHGNGHDHGSPSPKAPKVNGPSDAALMVCGDQPMERLTSILDLEQNPHTINDWVDDTFTCTYHLQEGALEISVQEAPDQKMALTYFEAMQALARDAKPIEGLANLGFPAYETADGSAVFQKTASF